MTRRLDEVEAGVNPPVVHLGPVDAVLLLEKGIEAGLNIIDDRLPADAKAEGEPGSATRRAIWVFDPSEQERYEVVRR